MWTLGAWRAILISPLSFITRGQSVGASHPTLRHWDTAIIGLKTSLATFTFHSAGVEKRKSSGGCVCWRQTLIFTALEQADTINSIEIISFHHQMVRGDIILTHNALSGMNILTRSHQFL